MKADVYNIYEKEFNDHSYITNEVTNAGHVYVFV